MAGRAVRRPGGRWGDWLRGFAPAAALLALLTVRPSDRLTAQEAQGPEMIDRIVAVVGDHPILLSEVDEKIAQARSQGLQVPEDSSALRRLRRQFLDDMIDEEVVYQQARRDTSISVTDAEIQSSVEGQYRQVRGNFRSEPEFRTALRGAGLGTPEEYRRYLGDQARRQAYVQRYIQRRKQDGKMRSGTITDAEMHQAYDQAARGGDLPRLPPTIAFRQILISPQPSDSARLATVQRAESVRAVIDRGGDFATLARRFSDDPGSREQGGDLGFFRRGMMVRPFEEVAFSLRPGQVSGIVRTEYGYHIIMVDRVQAGEIKARHILFTPPITPDAAARARHKADSVVTLLRAGANFDSLARIVSDSGEMRVVPSSIRDSLPAGYPQALQNAQEGQLVGPVALTPDAGDRSRLLIAQITQVLGEHTPTFEEMRDRIRSSLLDQKGMRNLVDDLKKQAYVNVRL